MKKLEIFKKDNIWHCELKTSQFEPFIGIFYIEDTVTADNWGELQIKIGNKNWVELLNKN